MNESGVSDSGNINSLWLANIYENLKNIEIFERYAREGCSSIFDYLQIPIQFRQIQIADAQYKNLRLLVNEMQLVIPDLSPIMEKTELDEIQRKIKLITVDIDKRNLFIKEPRNIKNEIIGGYTTEVFKYTLVYLSHIRQEIINKISHLLYLDKTKSKESTNNNVRYI